MTPDDMEAVIERVAQMAEDFGTFEDLTPPRVQAHCDLRALLLDYQERGRALEELLAIVDEVDAYQKRPGNGDYGVECACCMGELFDWLDCKRIENARATLKGKSHD
jgi:hypothetical protein